MRKGGMSRTQAQKHMGISAPTFYALLTQWGIKDRAVEEGLLLDDGAGQVPTSRVQASFEVSVDRGETKDQVPEEVHGTSIVIRFPMVSVEWPEQLESLSKVDRDTLIRVGLACLQNAAVWAYREVVDIIGDEDQADIRVQTFMERKCAEIGGVAG